MNRRFAVFLAVALVCGMVVVPPGAAVARRAPRVLTHSAPVTRQPVSTGWPIDYVGVTWAGTHRPAWIRWRHDGRWTRWREMIEDGVEAPGRYATGLAAGNGADAYQVRAPRGVRSPRALALDVTTGTTGGPAFVETQAHAAVPYVDRAGWGADETRRTSDHSYAPVRKLVVHHTATANNPADPVAAVRAIYVYHTTPTTQGGRGFADIGYQFLIDHNGIVYEGRWSGEDADPGHDAAGNGVVGAHVGGWNTGTLGTAMLGTFTDVAPTAAARDALEDLLAELAARHGLDPEGRGSYLNTSSGQTSPDVYNISGHRDWAATECPGGRLYAELPSIRASVADRLGGTEPPPDTQAPVISSVRARDIRRHAAAIRWTTNERATARVRYWRAGAPRRFTTRLESLLERYHKVALRDLRARTRYRYRVISADASGNRAVGGIHSFRTRR